MEPESIEERETLRSNKIFQEYLTALKNFTSGLIVIAVKDTPGFCFNECHHRAFLDLGLRENLVGKHWHGYAAAILDGSILFEVLGEKGAQVEKDLQMGRDKGIHVHIESKPYISGDCAAIVINKRNYAVNKRGINIVVYDIRNHYVIDSVSFDTNVPEIFCARKHDEEILGLLRDTRSQIKYLTEMIHVDLLMYHLNHQMLEARAREKVHAGKKLKVFFMVSYASKFGMRSLYRQMEESSMFEPYIFCVHVKDQEFWESEEYWQEVRKNFEIFSGQGYRAILGYDAVRRPYGMEKFLPDIVFYTNPNLSDTSYYRILSINYNYLTCYVPYGMCVVNQYQYHYENANINTAWKVFSDTFFSYAQVASKSSHNGINYVLSGFPKLDACAEPMHPRANRRKQVVVAPHWSIRTSDNMATFHLYHRQMMEMVDAFPEVDFYFKPHPDLRYRLHDLEMHKIDIGMTVAGYDEYLREWEGRENGFLVPDGDYMDLFMKSDALVTDCGSFIAEYLPIGKPCIYILNPERERPKELGAHYNALGIKILQSYYLCGSWEEVLACFRDAVIRGMDSKCQERKAILDREFVHIGSAGKFIRDYLAGILASE